MTSSLRNSIHRRNHKERSQLAHRQRLGILEKHKDYVKRARDYHSKQDRLNRLRQKAQDRNNDEFYFSMKKEQTRGGVHIKSRGTTSLPTDIVKLLKTQDENYVRTMRLAGLKKIDNLKDQLSCLVDLVKPLNDDDIEGLEDEEVELLIRAGIVPTTSSGKRSGHIKFEASQSTAPEEAPEDADMEAVFEEEDLGWIKPESKKKVKETSALPVPKESQSSSAEEASAHRRRLLKDLSARLLRDQYLGYAQRELEMQRLMMGKGRRKKVSAPEKVEGGNDDGEEETEDAKDARRGKGKAYVPKEISMEAYRPRVYKWKVERKR